jgi:hypothetical protein
MLVAFNAADYAAALEKKTPKAVKDEFMAILRTLFDSVPEPRSVSGSRCGRDRQIDGDVGGLAGRPTCIAMHAMHCMHSHSCQRRR